MSAANENLFKIDTSGQVWTINVSGKGGTSWTLLPNPTKTDMKRISSRNENVLWGVSSDHQIYVYVRKPDIPIRVKMETYENQRWFPVDGFSQMLLPTDRPHFSSEDGTKERTKDSILLPSESWEWETDWQIETAFENQLLDAQGWTYAVDFPASYHSEKSWKSCVRRRKWIRIRRYIFFDKWQKIEPIHADFTQEPFTDICVSTFGVSSPDISCVWAITVLGQVYFRTEVSLKNPEGTNWHQVQIKKGLEACQVSVSSSGVPLVVAWTGSLLYRIGLTPNNLIGTQWIEVNAPRDNGLLQVSAGSKALWGITRDHKCWALKGDLQDYISTGSTTFDWNEIPRKLKAISVSKFDQVVIGVGDDEDEIYVRFGIEKDQQHGQGWKKVFPGQLQWDAVSTSSSELTSSLDQTDDASGGSGDSMISIRPDYPKTCHSTVPNQKSGVSWVDGGCLSMLKCSGVENDIEVGPWREDILNSLQARRTSEKEFEYPEAVEKSEFVSWSKSTIAYIFQHGSDTLFVKGQLEILNNDTIVFHKTLNHRWICAMQDILSILSTRELAFTLRIRNSIEVGVSDFITFKFRTEKEFEDWFQVINELSQKPSKDMTMTNSWMTTTHGEAIECGLVKITDSPLEGEIITPSNTENETHYPLIKGFLPGSSIRIEISIPVVAEKFSMNLAGKTYVAFHFNPRFSSGCVVRNTMSHGDWGVEERDGVFPFVTGHSYIITIECTDTHIITTALVQRKQFIFTFRHRVAPKYITSFNACGDLNVLGIRYDPKSGHDSSQPEFITKHIPGHFWKIEGARPGFAWAIAYDFNVWVYTLSSKEQKKFDSDSFSTVTDDEIIHIYENQRWNPLSGFGHIGLPTDRSPWSDETGRIAMEKETVKLRSCKWKWITDWEVDYSVKNGADEDGWQYAIDFPASYHSSKRFNDFVRRRRWKRISRYAVDGPWQLISGVKLVDLTIQMNDDCEWEVLGVTKGGDAITRKGITAKNPAGTHWDEIPGEKSFISIATWFGHKYWAVGKDGYAYIRYSNNWQILDKPSDSQLKVIRVGPNGDVWAVGTNNTLYRRTNIIHPALPEGRDWCEAYKSVLNISFGPDGSLYALLKKKGGVFSSTLAKRIGILQDSPNGIGWDVIADGPWSHLSMCGSKTRSA